MPPTDQYYIQCTRGINLTAGATVRVVYALIAGADEPEFRANAALAQELYDNSFVGPQPPVTPTLSARAADRKVYLHWNDTAEVALDPLTGLQDFVGYKLYRSDNHGRTWGKVNYQTGNSCLTVDYTPLALYTVHNGKNIILNSWQQFNSIQGKNLSVAWKIDEEKLENFLKENVGTIHHPAQNASLVYDEKTQNFSVTPEKDGIGIDKEKLKNDLGKSIASKQTYIQLFLIKETAEVREGETESAESKVKQIIDLLPISIIINEDSEDSVEQSKEVAKIGKEELLNLIAFEPFTDPQNQKNKILGIKMVG